MSKLDTLVDALERELETNLRWIRDRVALASDPEDTDITQGDVDAAISAALAGFHSDGSGTHWFEGDTPDDTRGIEGDLWLTTDGLVYQKSGGTWF